MLKAILFDVYGTLLDTGTGSVEAAAKILEQAGRPDIPPKAFYARWKQLHRQHMAEASGGGRPGSFRNEEAIYHLDLRALYREYAINSDPDQDVGIMLATLGNRTPYPETGEVLGRLSPKVQVCIASITDIEPLQRDLGRAGLKPHKIYTSEGLGYYKPDPAFYTAILGGLGLQPQEALFVGDSLLCDVQGPQAVGIPACWVNRRGADPGAAAPDYTVADLWGLLPLVGA